MIMFPIYAKTSAIAKVVPFMLLNKSKLIMKAILMFQFGYCPLVWMNHNKTLNHQINSLHERALRPDYNNFKSSFHQLLEKDNSGTFLQHNTAQKMKFSIKDFPSSSWSHLLKKSLMQNFIFCAV